MTNSSISVSCDAPAKYIILGEHAVVYGQPALAAPLHSLTSTATVTPHNSLIKRGLTVNAPDINLSDSHRNLPINSPLANIIFDTLQALQYNKDIEANITITSTIPMESGLGSSASISTAIAKSLTAYLGCKLTNTDISNIVYKTEGLQHGNPSGIDNLVISHATPILFSKSTPVKYLTPSKPLHYVLAHSGEQSKTRDTVQLLDTQRLSNPQFNSTLNRIGRLSIKGADAFAIGDTDYLGDLMTTNHNLLQQLCVSSKRLDHLVTTAIEAGASGAKLSGAGRGGYIVAQVTKASSASVVTALKNLGTNPFVTTIAPHLHES